ncbi:MAG: hypothetical protein HDQ88_08930 [Clostridia bacterium]|nr:hypothetical protein [Clostridia bacterium]
MNAKWHATFIKQPTQDQLAKYYGVYDMFDPSSVFVIHHHVHGNVIAAFANIPDALTCFGDHNVEKGLPNAARLVDLGLVGHPVMLLESKLSRRLIPSV